MVIGMPLFVDLKKDIQKVEVKVTKSLPLAEISSTVEMCSQATPLAPLLHTRYPHRSPAIDSRQSEPARESRCSTQTFQSVLSHLVHGFSLFGSQRQGTHQLQVTIPCMLVGYSAR